MDLSPEYGMQMQKIFSDNSENKEDTVGIVRNDQIWKDCVGIATITDFSRKKHERCKNERHHEQDRILFQGGIQP